MAILKCKMCGGDLSVTEGLKIVECDFCGTTQTVPNADDEKKTNLFNRANRLRMDNEFDKAAGVYESIVSEFPEEAEGYWGLVLCSYGIEYVDDTKTGKKIPTCHRTITSSVMDNDNFIQACENADVIARGVYREEAKVIDKLQQKIIAVVENEEPYDVFICYKETDDITKSRTEDSLIAQDIYTELIKEGYKVFFSRVTLRNKAGTEYEPYIYAALKSAKVMLAIGTKFDYYDAVWVKNEWGRFISMMAEDNSKHLIPCFKNLDAYDIPKEFKNLQALDMGEVTFFKNLTDNVERFIPKQAAEPTKVLEVQTDSNSATVDSLLKRAFMFLEDGSWDKADEYCEKVLDINPECGEAYFGKLMVELHVKKRNELKNLKNAFNECSNYQKAVRFGNENLKKELEGYIEYIAELKKHAEQEEMYKQAVAAMGLQSVVQCKKAIMLFEKIPEYKDSKALAKKCDELIEKLIKYAQINNKEEKYSKGIAAMKLQSIYSYESALKHFESIPDYKDSKDKIDECKSAIKVLKAEMEKEIKEKEAKEAKERLEKEKKLKEKIIALGEIRKKLSVANDCLIQTPNPKNPMLLGLSVDGHVYISCDDEYRTEAKKWKDILKLSAGHYHVVSLKSDGTVCSAGDNKYGQCNVSSWDNITQISAGGWHTVGLKSNGTVVAVGSENYGKIDVSLWSDIVKVSAGKNHTVGLKSNGTVVATGVNDDGRCNVSDWHDIVDIWAFNSVTVGLKKDGTIAVVGDIKNCDVSGWTDIVDVSIGYDCVLGLKSDGTVLLTGNSGRNADVSEWKDIVSISAKNTHAVGLCADGSVVATGSNIFGQCNVNDWHDIVAISAGDFCTFGLKSDGCIVKVGEDNAQPHKYVSQWKLFNDYGNIASEQEIAKKSMEFRRDGLCQHCGGKFKGLFLKTCTNCGKKKDY